MSEEQQPAILQGEALRMDWPATVSLIDDLRIAGGTHHRGLTFVRADGTERYLSYRQLVAGAEAVRDGLQAAGVARGRIAVLQFGGDGPALLSAFWGCLLTGCTPVLMDPATGDNSAAGATKLLALLTALENPLIVADEATAVDLRSRDDLPAHEVVCVAISWDRAPTFADWAEAKPDDLAALLMTSGSQGGVKLVQQTHRTLRSMIAATVQTLVLRRDEVAFNWMPVTHVGGLVFLHLLPLCQRYSQVHVATNYVIENPSRWIELASRHRATMSWSPNFAFRLIADAPSVNNRPLDLSRLRVIANGGEPVSASVARAFVERLQPLGLPPMAIRPSFGMSECCSGLTWASPHRNWEHADSGRVPLGFPIPGTKIRIVDARGDVAHYGETGEVEIAGATLFAGYFGQPDLTREVLRDGWFRTGDAGYLCADGLVVTGRIKEQIIVSGLKFSPHDIEAAAEQCEGVLPSYTAATSISESAGAPTALFFAVADGFDPVEVSERIRMHVLRRVGIKPDHLVPISPAEIPKTSTGKIRKPELAKRFAADLRAGTGSASHLSSEKVRQTLPPWFYATAVRRRELVNVALDHASSPLAFICSDPQWGRSVSDAIAARGGKVHLIVAGADAEPAASGAEITTLAGALAAFRNLRAAGIYPRRVAYCVRASTAPSHGDLNARCLSALSALANVHSGMKAIYGPEYEWSLVALVLDARVAHGFRTPEAAAASGMLRCLSLESRTVTTTCLEVDLAAGAIAAVALELTSKITSHDVIIREGKRFATQLKPLDLGDNVGNPLPWRRGGIYVVTGGLGGIGRILARYLIQAVRAKVLILGRRRLTSIDGSQDGAAFLRTLQGHLSGEAGVLYRSADASRENEVDEAIVEAKSHWKQGVAGIIHLAGQRSAGRATEEFEAVLSPKVRGSSILADALDRHSEGATVPILIHFSSILGRFGAPGEGAYAAACNVQHALAASGNASGRSRHYSIGWSSWDGIGMSAGGNASLVRAKGFASIGPREGLLSLLALLSRDTRDALVGLDGEHAAIASELASSWTPPDRRLVVALPRVLAPPNVTPEDPFGVRIPIEFRMLEGLPRGADGAVDRELLRQHFLASGDKNNEATMSATERQIAPIWAAILAVDSVGPHSNFFTIGGDSMKATQAVARTNAAIGLRQTVRSLFDYPTLRGFAAEVDRYVTEASDKSIMVRKVSGRRSPLGYAQGRLWFLNQLHGPNTTYNIVCAFVLRGRLDKAALAKALRSLVERHEALRSTFAVDRTDQPYQEIGDCPDEVLQQAEACGLAQHARRQLVSQVISTELSHVFDLSHGPLFRARLVTMDDEEHALCLNMHHIVSDGWSFRVLFSELSTLYACYVRGNESTLSPPQHRYFDFVDWQDRWLRTIGDQQLSYWQQKLRGLQNTRLTQSARPASRGGNLLTLYLLPELVTEVDKLCARSDMTLFMVLMAALGVVIHEHTGESDIGIGTAVANRTRSEWEQLVGFFVNTLVMRITMDARTTVATLLRNVKEDARAAYANQDVPFERVVEAVKPARSHLENPLFSIMMVLQPDVDLLTLEGLSVERVGHRGTGAKFDILFSFSRVAGGLELMVEYDTELFSEELVRRFHKRIAEVMANLCSVERTCDVGTLIRSSGRHYGGAMFESGVF